MLHRRAFFQQSANGATAGVACHLASLVSYANAENKKYPPGKFFDFHTHIGLTANHAKPLPVEELLRWMDAHDISQAAVLPLISPEATSYVSTPDYVLAETKPYRDRLVPFCCIDPRTDYSGGKMGLVGMLTRYVEAGAKGFGEHKTGVAIDDPRNMKLYEACAEVKIPVLFHMDNARNMDQPGLPALARVLEAFPTVTFLGHAFGWWAAISGGITQAEMGTSPKGQPVHPGGAIDILMDKYPNIYGDLSASAGAAAIARDLKFGREFLLRRADRLVFGTDYFSPGQSVAQFDLYQRLDLPEEAARKIYRENARRLLNL